SQEGRFRNNDLERTFDTVRDIVSVANAARNVAALKRRWPVSEVLVCGPALDALEKMDGISDVLKTQLNAEQYSIVEIPSETQLGKVTGLVEKKMPVEVTISLIRRNVAPKVKADIGKVSEAFERADRAEMLALLASKGTFGLAYERGGGEASSVELVPSDLDIAYKAGAGYAASERDGLVVFVSTRRDRELTAKGLLRDLARRLQQLRKERGFMPSEVLGTAYAAGLSEDEISMLSPLKDELKYLVRVRQASLSAEPDPKVNYSQVELDGREFLLSVE
ncbi:MAG TPA: DUF5915 domain-containing protein, partial [Nitrososphaera sp.]|nr:DUF5915 domain-containing protein [Nitrososphaera sp.]